MKKKNHQKETKYPFPDDCVSSNYPRIIHNQETWEFIQESYRQSQRELNLSVPTKHHHHKTGMLVPYEIRDDGPRGRTIHVTQDIKKGTKVWQSIYFAKFHTKVQFTTFLQKLPHDLQCDVLLWAYPQKGKSSVGLALDDGSFMNHGESEELLNMDNHDRTNRDIAAGVEILEDYGSFIGINEIQWFDELRKIAWEEDKYAAKKKKKNEESTAAKIMKGYVNLGVPDIDNESQTNTLDAAAAAGGKPQFQSTIMIHNNSNNHNKNIRGASSHTNSDSIHKDMSMTERAMLSNLYSEKQLPVANVLLCVMAFVMMTRRYLSTRSKIHHNE